MIALLWFVLAILASPFKSKSRLEAENAALRRQFSGVRCTAGSGSPITIAYSLCSSIVGSHRSVRFLRSSVQRRSSDGIGSAFAVIGAGSRAQREGVRGLSRSYAVLLHG